MRVRERATGESAWDPSDGAEYAEREPFREAAKEPLLTRAIPVAGPLRRYRAPKARRDLVAGVTVAALALPSAMAYAEVAGLSPVHGLYALLLPTVAYVLLGLAVVHYTTRGRSWRPFALWGLYAALVLTNTGLSLLIAILGLIEQMISLRRPTAPPPSGGPST